MQNMDTQFINQEHGEQVFYEHRGFDFCYVAIGYKMLLNEYPNMVWHGWKITLSFKHVVRSSIPDP